jgi:hypothetical protein
MPRAQNRAGYGSLSGANNPRLTIGAVAPKNPKDKDLFVNTTDECMYRWDGSADPQEWVLAVSGGSSNVTTESDWGQL